MLYGMPIVLLGIPLAAWIIGRVQGIATHPFDVAAARTAIARDEPLTTPEKRLIPLVAVNSSFQAGQAALIEAGLAFLGLGDRNYNRILDRGPVPKSVRLRAVTVARFSFSASSP